MGQSSTKVNDVETKTPKVVLICTSSGELQGHSTGVWIEELASPYYTFKSAGFEVEIASPKGGPIPIDAGSLGEGFFTESAKKFMHDSEAVGMLCHSTKVDSIDLKDADAIFMAGGHGTAADFVNNAALKNAIESMYKSGKVVAAVCHGPMCLVDCVKEDGSPLVQGLTVTGFSDVEEEVVQMTTKVPFLLETKLKELGGNYEKAEAWNSKVCVDGKLVTGQNPASSEDCAKATVELVK